MRARRAAYSLPNESGTDAHYTASSYPICTCRCPCWDGWQTHWLLERSADARPQNVKHACQGGSQPAPTSPARWKGGGAFRVVGSIPCRRARKKLSLGRPGATFVPFHRLLCDHGIVKRQATRGSEEVRWKRRRRESAPCDSGTGLWTVAPITDGRKCFSAIMPEYALQKIKQGGAGGGVFLYVKKKGEKRKSPPFL